MITNETAQKLSLELKHGDKLEISKRAEVATISVIRFFNGDINKLTSKMQEKIMKGVIDIVSERQKRARELEKKAIKMTVN